MTTVQENKNIVKVLRESKKDYEGKDYDFDYSLASTINVHHPRNVSIDTQVVSPAIAVKFSNHDDHVSVTLFMSREELTALREGISEALGGDESEDLGEAIRQERVFVKEQERDRD